MALAPIGSTGTVSGSTGVDVSDTGYRGLDSDTTMAYSPSTGIKDYGDDLKGVQNDLYAAGYYPSGSEGSTEVDGKMGPKTTAAVKQLQTDLKTAGLYDGPANGVVDGKLATAMGSLKNATVPSDLDPAVKNRLQGLSTSSQQPVGTWLPSVTVTASRSGFDQASAPKVPLMTPSTPATTTATPPTGHADGATVADKTLTALGNYVDPTKSMSDAQRYRAVASFAQKHADAHDGVAELSKDFGPTALGFNPAHNSEGDVDKFLSSVAQTANADAATLQAGGNINGISPAQSQADMATRQKILSGIVNNSSRSLGNQWLQANGLPPTDANYQTQVLGREAQMLQTHPAMMQQFMQSQGLNANDPHTAKLFNDVSQFLTTGYLPAAQNGGSVQGSVAANAGANGAVNTISAPAAVAVSTLYDSTNYNFLASQAAQFAQAPDPRDAYNAAVANQARQAQQQGPGAYRPNFVNFNANNYDAETFRKMMQQASQAFAQKANAPQSSTSTGGYRATMPTYN